MSRRSAEERLLELIAWLSLDLSSGMRRNKRGQGTRLLREVKKECAERAVADFRAKLPAMVDQDNEGYWVALLCAAIMARPKEETTR